MSWNGVGHVCTLFAPRHTASGHPGPFVAGAREPSDSVTLGANDVQLLTHERQRCPFIETAATTDAYDQRAQVVRADGAIDYLTLADVRFGGARRPDHPTCSRCLKLIGTGATAIVYDVNP
jgi:hypothetical protein